MPIFDPSGHSTPGVGLLILACLGVQASRPWAADSLRVRPSGRVVVAVLSCDESSFAGSGSWGTESSTVTPSG